MPVAEAAYRDYIGYWKTRRRVHDRARSIEAQIRSAFRLNLTGSVPAFEGAARRKGYAQDIYRGGGSYNAGGASFSRI